jgi:hypothetical protein
MPLKPTPIKRWAYAETAAKPGGVATKKPAMQAFSFLRQSRQPSGLDLPHSCYFK